MSGLERPTAPKPRASTALLAVLGLLACALLAPAAALAAAEGSVEGGNSFNELAQKAQQEETTTPTTTSTTKNSESETRNSSKTILLVAGAAAVLLAGIAFVIVRDARRVAPAGPDEVGEGRRGTDPVARRRNRRAKAKAARQQRKKNR